jgi:hypothetical protein
MQRTTLQQHKDIVITCEEGIIKVEGYNQLIIPKPTFGCSHNQTSQKACQATAKTL